MASDPSADQNHYTYQVFLSFRGKDTRCTFTDHLHNTLCERGINTFRDDDKLRKGKEISLALPKAIEESRVSIIVFSENYASSSWCLDELVKILECRKSKGQEVRAVFYKVDPADVRHQRPSTSFGDAFATLECRHKDRMDEWKKALEEAAGLSGWTLKDGEHEASFINKIVGELSAVVNSSYELLVAEHPVGIESCRREIESRLDVEEKIAVRTVGIWGTGGIGKTAIAKAVYNSVQYKFDGSCFLADVRSKSSSHKALAELQETLLSRILRDPTLKVNNVDEGVSFIKERMRQKKVLLILDDVSDPNQLKILAPSPDCCFGPGSRIIITTRDRRSLIDYPIASIYEVKVLDNDRALELFSWHAFKPNGPPDDFLELAQRAVHYAQGLPLALMVLGSHLFKRSRVEWEATLDSCSGLSEIQDILKISYFALREDYLKQLFLDIACFFKGKREDDVTPILQACGRNPGIGMKQLVEKALIRIEGNQIWMHDLIEAMGKDIVNQEGEPGECSRLWKWNDFDRVLRDNTGTNKIKGIQVRGQRKMRLNTSSFSKMKNLMYFSCTSGVFNSRNIDYLSHNFNLRWLDWPKCPMKSFPLNFHPKDLVALNIPGSRRITQLWKGYKSFPNLTYVDLSGCVSLIKLPDFTESLNLKELNLKGCESLVEVHDSVGSLNRLETLHVGDCSKLVKLPREISLKYVQTISLGNCTSLEEFPKIIGKMDSLSSLNLSRSGIKELDPSIGNLIGLTRLYLNGCKNLMTLPCNIYELRNLEVLDVSGCSKLDTFSKNIGKMDSLRELRVSGSGIKELHLSIGNLIGLTRLCLDECRHLTTLPCNIYELKNLKVLDVSGCSKLDTFSKNIGKMDSLRELRVSGSGIKELHPSIRNLIGVKYLFLDGCKNLTTLPCSIYGLQNLEWLSLRKCSKLVTFPTNTKGDGSLSLPKLKILATEGCNLSDCDFLETLDCFETLIQLDLSRNNFVSLPACISKFVNLETLDLHCCKRLREILELPPKLFVEDNGGPRSLRPPLVVDVCDCESLEKLWKSKESEQKESQGIKWKTNWIKTSSRSSRKKKTNIDNLTK